jgi:hypothetical protein
VFICCCCDLLTFAGLLAVQFASPVSGGDQIAVACPALMRTRPMPRALLMSDTGFRGLLIKLSTVVQEPGRSLPASLA